VEEEAPVETSHEYDDPIVKEVVKSDVPITMEEAHAMDGKSRPQTYEELYGTKPLS